MKRITPAVLVAILIVPVAPRLTFAQGDRTEKRPSALVPAYFYPAGAGLEAWRQLAESARTRTIEVILNPASGPGEKRDPTYVQVATDVRKAGGKLLGYIRTDYAKREIGAVDRDFRKYLGFYDVDGIFLDEMAATQESLPYYRKIHATIKQARPGFRIVGNPGQPWVDEAHMKSVDCLVMFEGSAAEYADYHPERPSPWIKNYPATRFATIVHTVGSPQAMRAAIRKATETRSGWVFITTREMPNPYDALPSYWSEELREIESRKPTPARK